LQIEKYYEKNESASLIRLKGDVCAMRSVAHWKLGLHMSN